MERFPCKMQKAFLRFHLSYPINPSIIFLILLRKRASQHRYLDFHEIQSMEDEVESFFLVTLMTLETHPLYMTGFFSTQES